MDLVNLSTFLVIKFVRCEPMLIPYVVMLNGLKSIFRSKVNIPTSRIEKLFSRGSGNGGQNLHASHSRCQIKFDINAADWIPIRVKHIFLQQFGKFVTSKGIVVITREDTRSPSDNEKLAIKELQTMLDKSEALSLIERDDVQYETELERIKSTKTESQVARYKNRMLKEKKMRSDVKRNRNRKWD
jgi:protein subunit release factor B